MGKKWLYLALALALPGMVFVFLKNFGENQFDVPVMFTSAPIEAPGHCDIPAELPYKVPEASRVPIGGLTAVAFVAPFRDKAFDQLQFQLQRLVTEFEGADFHVMRVDTTQKNQAIAGTLLSSLDYEQERACHFLLPPGLSIVLVDGERQIRGQYEASQKEIERLSVEVKILLKNY